MTTLTKQNDKKCPGWFYRARANNYITNGELRTDQRLIPLKRKSCSGCSKCDWITTALSEQYGNDPLVITGLVDGGLYKLNYEVDIPTAPYFDDWAVEFSFFHVK